VYNCEHRGGAILIFNVKCFKCTYKTKYIDLETKQAKEFYQEHGVGWRFACGAEFNKSFLNTKHGCEVYPVDCILERKQ